MYVKDIFSNGSKIFKQTWMKQDGGGGRGDRLRWVLRVWIQLRVWKLLRMWIRCSGHEPAWVQLWKQLLMQSLPMLRGYKLIFYDKRPMYYAKFLFNWCAQ